MALLELVSLYVHIVSAIVFVGGSLFIWLALSPGLNDAGLDERSKGVVLAKVSRRFGKVVDVSLAILILTGLYNVTWYLPSLDFASTAGRILAAKIVAVGVLVASIYYNNLVLGKRIVKLRTKPATPENSSEIQRTRKTVRRISMFNVALMLLVVLLAVMLQIPP